MIESKIAWNKLTKKEGNFIKKTTYEEQRYNIFDFTITMEESYYTMKNGQHNNERLQIITLIINDSVIIIT